MASRPNCSQISRLSVPIFESSGPGLPSVVIGVDAVDHQRSVDTRCKRRVLQDLADGAASGAPAAEHHAGELEAGLALRLVEQVRKPLGVFEQAGVGARSRARLHRDDRHLIARAGHLRQPRAAVEEEQDGRTPAGFTPAEGTARPVPASRAGRAEFVPSAADAPACAPPSAKGSAIAAPARRPPAGDGTSVSTSPFCFRRFCLHRQPQMAVVPAIAEVDGQPDRQPDAPAGSRSCDRANAIMAKQTSTPRIGTSGTSGVR